MAKRIYVNNEYKKAFESICQLIDGGCFSGLGWKVSDGIISDGVYEYELTTVFKGDSEKVKHGFKQDGATWFKALRGEYVENNNAIWTSFIETVGIEYHKRYSVVEYQQQPRTQSQKARDLEDNKAMIDSFTKLFYPEFYQKTEVVEVEGEETKEDIYGVAMRIELSGGTGASLPVLCKVYFSKTGRTITPIAGFISQGIDENLAEIIPEDNKNDQTISGEGIIDTTLNAMDNLINNTNVNFADYICYSDVSDKIAVENLLAQLSHDAVELECQRVDVLYITRITATSYLYDVMYAGRPLFRLSHGLDRALTLRCLNCASFEKIVDSNRIAYTVDGEPREITLQPNLEDFGLTEEQVEEIKEFSALKNHFIHIKCSLANRRQECKVIKCMSQLFNAGTSDVPSYKCKDCPYPEIVYTTLSGEKKYTPSLIFAKDLMTLVDTQLPETEVEKCACCGRYFTKSSLRSKFCQTCYGAINGQNIKDKKKLYKKYKNLLPLSIRFFALSSKKLCVEDEELIVFSVGKKKYAFNKLCVKEKGYFNKPHRMF